MGMFGGVWRTVFVCVFACMAGAAHAGVDSAAGMISPGPWISPSRADAARFLAQATFGASDADIAHLQRVGYLGWINEQAAATVSLEKPYLDWDSPSGDNNNQNPRREIWTINALGAPDPSRSGFPGNAHVDQLRQRMAFALSEIFVVSSQNSGLSYQQWALGSFYDVLAKDAFANYRTLLEDVTKHPAMGNYLSMIQNRKADASLNIHPDENYAREVLQLFSIGLNQLNADGTRQLDGNGQPLPTYDQTTVRGFAAVFTGWNYTNVGCGPSTYNCCDADHYFDWGCAAIAYNSPRWQLPMQPIEAWHDSTSDKQLLQYPGVALANGVLVHGGDAQAEMTAALDNIFHHPNVGPFIGRQLIQRLVTSNPSPAYVARVAAAFNDNGSGVRGDLLAVLKAILLDAEARSIPPGMADSYGKLREPIIKFTHLWRAMAARSSSGRIDNFNTYPQLQDWIGQAPLASGSVFNFFSPFFVQPGEPAQRGLKAPEFQILTDMYALNTPDRLYHEIFCNYSGSGDCWAADDPGTIQNNIQRDAALAMSNPGQLLDQYNLLFLSGQMSGYMRGIILDRINKITSGNRGASAGMFRVQHALYLILNSPEYSIQK